MPKLNPSKELVQTDSYRKENNICSEAEFINAVKSGNVENVKKLNFLDEHLEYREALYFDEEFGGCDYDSGSVLMHAVSSNNIQMTKYLLDNGANANDSCFDDGKTVLQAATRTGNEALVRLLLEKGADPTVSDFGLDEERPVDIARQQGFTKIANMLTYFYHNYFSEKSTKKTQFFSSGYEKKEPASKNIDNKDATMHISANECFKP